MTSQIKVYISNLNYHTTEEELREYLADTKATNVFIPNYFVGFGSSRFKPLGIAYADLPNPEDAESFIKEFEGKSFKDRKLKIKLHVPYSPSQKLTRLSSVHSIKRLSRKENDEPKEENKENVAEEIVCSPVEKEFSSNGIFVKGLKGKTCEEDLKAIFKDFNPTDVKFFKPKGWMRGLKNRSHNAIVTLDLPDKITLDEVINSCSGEKCCGNSIVVTKAYLNGDRANKVKLGDTANSSPTNESPIEDTGTQVGEKFVADDLAEDAAEEAIVAEASLEDEENSKDESGEQTMQSFEQENASKKAICEGNGGLVEHPEIEMEATAA